MDTAPPLVGRKPGQRPRMLVCYLCSREFGSKSLPIHIPQCQKKWLQEEEQKPKKDRRPLPQPPAADPLLKAGGASPSAQQIDDFNDEARAAFEASLEKCPHCQRRFLPKAYTHHSKACTAKNPAKPAGTGLTAMSLTNRLVPGAIAGSRHGKATEQPPSLYKLSRERLKLLEQGEAGGEDHSSPVRRDLSSPVRRGLSSPVRRDVSSPVRRDLSSPARRGLSPPVRRDISSPVRRDPGQSSKSSSSLRSGAAVQTIKPWLAKKEDTVVVDRPVET